MPCSAAPAPRAGQHHARSRRVPSSRTASRSSRSTGRRSGARPGPASRRRHRAADGVEARRPRARCSPGRPASRRIATCSRPLASAQVGPRRRAADAGRRPRRSAVRRGSTTISRPPRALLLVEILHDRRHRVGGVAADQQDAPRPRRCRRPGTAARGRCRTPGCAAAAADAMQKRPL